MKFGQEGMAMKGKKDYSEAGKTEIAGWTDRETGAENRKNIDEL